MKFNVINALEKTNKVVGLVASISFGIAITIISASAIKRAVKEDLLPKSSKQAAKKPSPKKKEAPKAEESNPESK